MQCPHCGNKFTESDRFCPACKTSLNASPSADNLPIPALPKISKLAIASRNLGILSLCCFASMLILSALGLPEMLIVPICMFLSVLFGIVGIIIGIIAIIKIFSNRGLKGKVRSIIGIFMSSVSILLVLMLISALMTFASDAKKEICRWNLKMIGKAMINYRDNHQGAYPADLSLLIHKADLDPKSLICPMKILDESESCSYIYRGKDLNKQDHPKLILAYDKPTNHKDGVRYVLFADGHVSKTTKKQFEKAIKKDNQIRRELGLAEKKLEGENLTEGPPQTPNPHFSP